MAIPDLDRAIGDARRILLDSSTLIAYHSPAEAAYPLAAHLIARMAVEENPLFGFCSMVSASELLVRPIRAGGLNVILMHRFLTESANLELVPVALFVAMQTANLRSIATIRLPDALIVASGMLSACEVIISNDERWKRQFAPLYPQFRWLYLNDYLPAWIAQSTPGRVLPMNEALANDDASPDGVVATANADESVRITELQEKLLAWYEANRRDLPWRRTRDPYHILLSEMMLQQTQVPRVLPRYLAWLERFPTLEALAAAPTADVLREWSGLGYNSRAVRLQAVARHVVAEHGGRMPRDVEALLALPGIGDYTARAVACFAYERDVPVLDTNVKRVLHRVLVGSDAPKPQLTDRQFWALAERAVPAGRGYDWNQGLMDFGSSICTARKPACLICPLRDICKAAPYIGTALVEQETARRRVARAGGKAATPFTSTNRFFRGQVLRALGGLGVGEALGLAALGPQVKDGYADADRDWLYALVAGLHRDGLVVVQPAPFAAGVVREEGAEYRTGDGGPGGEDDLVAVRVSLPEG